MHGVEYRYFGTSRRDGQGNIGHIWPEVALSLNKQKRLHNSIDFLTLINQLIRLHLLSDRGCVSPWCQEDDVECQEVCAPQQAGGSHAEGLN